MFHINSYMPVCNRTKKYFISPNLGYSSSILPFYVCHLPSTHSYLLCKYLYRFFMLIHIYVPKNYFISSNLGYSSILPFYVCHLTRTHSYVLYKYYIKIADRMDARVEEALQTLTDIAEIGEYMKRETKEEMLKAVSALKNYFTVQEKALTAKSEKNIPSVEVKDAQTETMPEENLSYTEQVATSSGRKQKPTRSSQHVLLTPTGEMANDQSQEMANDQSHVSHQVLEQRITEKISEKIRPMVEGITNNIKKMKLQP